MENSINTYEQYTDHFNTKQEQQWHFHTHNSLYREYGNASLCDDMVDDHSYTEYREYASWYTTQGKTVIDGCYSCSSYKCKCICSIDKCNTMYTCISESMDDLRKTTTPVLLSALHQYYNEISNIPATSTGLECLTTLMSSLCNNFQQHVTRYKNGPNSINNIVIK